MKKWFVNMYFRPFYYLPLSMARLNFEDFPLAVTEWGSPKFEYKDLFIGWMVNKNIYNFKVF